MKTLVITATDTDVGKTVCASLLMTALQGTYWKPVQCGTNDNGLTDYDIVRRLSGLADSHFIDPVYSFKAPLSPHRAAELENKKIDIAVLKAFPPLHHPCTQRGDTAYHSAGGDGKNYPQMDITPSASSAVPVLHAPLFIEGAGGLMVPLTRDTLYIDLFQQWNAPVVLCARTGLGTINHTLLSIEALKSRNVPVHGIIFIGNDNMDTMKTILDFSGVKKLGWIPAMADIARNNLIDIFKNNFKKEDWI